MTAHQAFFGDGDYSFRITFPMACELEKKTGSSIGALWSRIFSKQFSVADLHETIRCALIGAGTDPKRAVELITAYAIDRPLSETYPLALAIAEHHWFGNPNQEPSK